MSQLTDIQKIKAEVEKAAWKSLDDFFKKVKPDSMDHDKAKISIMALATIFKSDALELNEMRLLKGGNK